MQPTRRLGWACAPLMALLLVWSAQVATSASTSAGRHGAASTVSSTRHPFSPDCAPPGHPKHIIKTWTTTYRGRTFRVTQLPRCEDIEAVVAYRPGGETKEQAKARLGGVAVSTGGFYDPRSLALADFYQLDGSILSGASTGRTFFALTVDGRMFLTDDYVALKGAPGVTALALGQRLVPLQKDGFSSAFMRETTDRMALGMNGEYIFIVQGKSDLYRLAEFMRKKLPVRIAVNADGGHVVRGRSPVHIVFRWRHGSAGLTQTPALDQLQLMCLPSRASAAAQLKPKA